VLIFVKLCDYNKPQRNLLLKEQEIMYRVRALLFVFIMAGLMIGCSGGTAEPSAAETTSGKMEVLGAWGRTSPKVAQNGAFYMKLVNNTGEDDKLLSATAEACNVVELHEMYMMGDGVMGMRPVETGYIPVAAGETVELKVGGLHVMCIGKLADFNVGDTYPVSLEFEKAGTMQVTVEIREMDASSTDMNMESGG
jgi:copper(I)-binding protein